MVPRLPRNTRVSPVTAGWKIQRSSRDRFSQIATHANLSGGALLDLGAANIALDENGRPTWLPLALPRMFRSSVVTAGWAIEQETRDTFNRIASHVGLTGGVLFDLWVENMELDHTGRPTWLPADPSAEDGVLPIGYVA